MSRRKPAWTTFWMQSKGLGLGCFLAVAMSPQVDDLVGYGFEDGVAAMTSGVFAFQGFELAA